MDTIVALSTGPGIAALAVIRLSGPAVRFVVETIAPNGLRPREAKLVSLKAANGELLDRCIALGFAAPHSATGEDVLELHTHGSTAVVQAVLAHLVSLRDDVRLATPGEFTRRALENGKLDLLQVEALGDLLQAETRQQLRQAQHQMQGTLGALVRSWVDRIVILRARLEAALDFADEGDVDDDGQLPIVQDGLRELRAEMLDALGSAERGIRLRDGVKVVIAGAPNVGKSTLMNALSGRDMSIVTPEPGTTRDVVECSFILEGCPVILSDTAGLRASHNLVEQLGIAKARERIAHADLILSLRTGDNRPEPVDSHPNQPSLAIWTKTDIFPPPAGVLAISAHSGAGIVELKARLADAVRGLTAGEPALVSRQRQRDAMSLALADVERAISGREEEIVAEDLRRATAALGRLVGTTDLDTVLDRLFEGFCIGK